MPESLDEIDVEKRANAVEAELRDRSKDNPYLFIKNLIIPAPGPVLFFKVMKRFQWEFFEDISPSLLAVRNGDMPPQRRFWVERTKKAAKDSDIAACLLWLMAFPTRPLKCQVVACDKQQAGVIAARIIDYLHYNPWLNDLVEVKKGEVRNKKDWRKVWTRIEASDKAGGAHGEIPDMLVLDELTHAATAWTAIQGHLNNADGSPQGIVIVATNAGWQKTDAEDLRNLAKESPNWAVYIYKKPPPWMNYENLKESRIRDTHARFQRLYYGVWEPLGSGDALDSRDIECCFSHDVHEVLGPVPGWRVVLGLDLGISHDHAALVVLGAHVEKQLVRTLWYRSWKPDERTGKVDLIAVKDTCLAMHRTFHAEVLWYDPYEAQLMAQLLAREGVRMKEMGFASPANCTKMAVALMQTVKARKLQCYEDEEGTLRRDFGKFVIVERAKGNYKLEAVSDKHGHADVGTALAICLPDAVSMLEGYRGLQPGDDVVCDDDSPLTQEEIDTMPQSLRDIHDFYDGMLKDQRRGIHDFYDGMG